MTVHEGGCLCGTVRYRTASVPERVTYCNCRFCQRATGAAYLVEPVFLRENFAVTEGQPKVYQVRSEGSGKMVSVHFCADCGTKLYLTFERFPAAVGLFGGTFDNPDWFERTPENTRYIFLDVAQRGTVIPAGFDCYPQQPLDDDDQPRQPTRLAAPLVVGS